MPEGTEIPEESWEEGFAKSLAVYFNGQRIRCVDYQNNKIVDAHFFLIFNAHEEPIDYVLPPKENGNQWYKVLDTHENYLEEEGARFEPESTLQVPARSVVVLKCPLEK